MHMHESFQRDILANRNNRAILARWEALALPDGWLVAGCLFQTVWNLRTGLPAEAHIKDYDLFYFDDSDLTPQGEEDVQQRVGSTLEDLGIVVEAKNQARVHLWYEEHFGFPYPRLRSACDGIDRFLVTSTCVGVRPDGAGLQTYAPNGLTQLYNGILSPNRLTDHPSLFDRKAGSYRERWPWLQVDAGT